MDEEGVHGGVSAASNVLPNRPNVIKHIVTNVAIRAGFGDARRHNGVDLNANRRMAVDNAAVRQIAIVVRKGHKLISFVISGSRRAISYF